MKFSNGERFSAIANNDDIYTFSVDVPMEQFRRKSDQNVVLYHSFWFLDNFWFMTQSIHSFAKTTEIGDFKMFKGEFPDTGEALYEKITKKVSFP